MMMKRLLLPAGLVLAVVLAMILTEVMYRVS